MIRQDPAEENKRLEAWIDDLQSGMYINCVYCGHQYGPNDGPTTRDFNLTMRKALEAHIAECPKHPLSVTKALLAARDAELAAERELREKGCYHEDGVPCPNLAESVALRDGVIAAQAELDRAQTRCRELEETLTEWKRAWRTEAGAVKAADEEIGRLRTENDIASVAGVYMDRSIADFWRACDVLLKEEQENVSPNNALIGVLCDAVRLSRELVKAVHAKEEGEMRITKDDLKRLREVTDSPLLSTVLAGFIGRLAARLPEKAREGFTGWEYIGEDEYRERAIRNIEKGDYVDGANLCMLADYAKRKDRPRPLPPLPPPISPSC